MLCWAKGLQRRWRVRLSAPVCAWQRGLHGELRRVCVFATLQDRALGKLGGESCVVAHSLQRGVGPQREVVVACSSQGSC